MRPLPVLSTLAAVCALTTLTTAAAAAPPVAARLQIAEQFATGTSGAVASLGVVLPQVNPCRERVDVTLRRDAKRFLIKLGRLTKLGDRPCPAHIQRFVAMFPIGRLAPGRYDVTIAQPTATDQFVLVVSQEMFQFTAGRATFTEAPAQVLRVLPGHLEVQCVLKANGEYRPDNHATCRALLDDIARHATPVLAPAAGQPARNGRYRDGDLDLLGKILENHRHADYRLLLYAGTGRGLSCDGLAACTTLRPEEIYLTAVPGISPYPTMPRTAKDCRGDASCLAAMALAIRDPLVCAEIDRAYPRGQCLSDLAIASDDPRLCKLIQDCATCQESCAAGIGSKRHDPSLCSGLSEPYRANCESHVRTGKP
ncbi:MAG: hypothetical protein H6Q90_5188 [Deltaproteobacteria bacterium]|nr:hypothetical protein [Deltaproteobacteria bacterium]